MQAFDTDNSQSGVRRSRRGGDRWEAFDSLPPLIRAALMEGAYDMAALDVVARVRLVMREAGAAAAEADALEIIAASHVMDRRMFAKSHWGGLRKSPHLAAKATMQTYGPLLPRPRKRRAAWRLVGATRKG